MVPGAGIGKAGLQSVNNRFFEVEREFGICTLPMVWDIVRFV